MKKKPILFFLLAAVSTLSVSAAACKHTHSYEGYGSDDAGHWQQCTECEEKTEKENHVDADKNGKCDVCEHDIPVVSVPVTGVSLNKKTLTLIVGATETLVATVAPDTATNKELKWETSDGNIATVVNGKVTAVAAGEVVITVKTADGNKQDTCTVTVNPATVAVTEVTLNKTTLALDKGGEETLTATVTPDNATDKTIVWTSSDEEVASVDENGKVTALAGGTATIKAECGGHEATCALTVTVPTTGLNLNKTTLALDIGGEETLTATVAPSDATNKAVVWSSLDETVATVDENGKVTAIKGGVVTIKVAQGEIEATCEVEVSATVTFNMKGHGTAIASVKVVAAAIEAPEAPTDGSYTFGGWYETEDCSGTAFNFDTVITENITLYAKWSEHEHNYDVSEWKYDSQKHYHGCTLEGCEFRKDEAEHQLNDDLKCTVCGVQLKDATFELIPSNLSAQTYTDGFKVGIFSLLPTTTVRNRERLEAEVFDLEDNVVATGFNCSKSVQYNGTKRGISIYAPAPGKLTLYLDNGSSGLGETDFQKIILTNPDGTTEEVAYPAKKLRCVVLNFDKEGEYTLTRGSNGTTDIYYAKYEARVAVTPIEKMQISSPGKVEYLVGDAFDSSELQAQLVYTVTQMVEPILVDDAHLTIDSSAFDNTTAGKYVIKLTYTDDNGNEFNAEYEVSVYDVESLELGFNKIVQGNDGYNGIYVNEAVQQLYFVGDTLNLDGLTVKTVFNGGKKKVIVTEGFTVLTAEVDMTTAGLKEVTVRWGDSTTIVAKYNVYVMAKPVVAGETITVNVSGACTDVGAYVEEAYRFKTIKQALDFLEGLELDQNVKKVINLAEGTYEEKVEINVPNLTIKGGTDATKTIIEWDALFGEKDDSGFEHTTDSTATLNVRRAATGFAIEGVTISNKWNSTEYFDEMKGPKYGEHRALAVLIQADKVVVDNCRMLGYQDTVEFFTGRQYVKNTYIQGRTDFIFGTNNTTYFENCEIRSIVSTGYVTAFKGVNTSGTDVLYGAIFDRCRFTAPEDVTAAKDTAIGRPWGSYAAVAVINSELGGHISTTEYSGKAAGERYVTMSNSKPTDPTVKFVEYNNTGAGAITEQQAGMTMLDAATAANYSDLSKVFAKKNGNVSYTTDWDGSKGVIITEFNYRFGDHYTADDGYTFHEATEAEPFFGDLATIKGSWGHELNQNKDQAKFTPGVTIRFNVAGEVTVTPYGGSYGLAENFVINYINGKAVINVVATENSPIANGAYATMFTLDKSKQGVHTHVYGEWTITAPSTENEGLAERVCADCELETPDKESVTLPVLSLENYDAVASQTEGKLVYTLKEEPTIVFEAEIIPGVHVHDYSEWVISATATEAGTATKTCNGTEGTCDAATITINIPALTDAAYTITNNTAKLDVAGTGDYSIEVDGEVITFNAATPAIKLDRLTEDLNYTYMQGDLKDGALVPNTAAIVYEKCYVNNSWVKFGGEGSSITLNLPEGATLKFTRSPYDNAEKIAINGVLQEGAKGNTITYVVKVPGYVVITADNTAYFNTLSVEIDPNYQHSHTYGDWNVTVYPTTEEVGSATRDCRVLDCGVDGATQTVELPVLSVTDYTITASQNAGKSIYTLKSEVYTELTFEADSLPDVHVHDYGEWQITAPTADNAGSAVKHCNGAGECPDGDIEVELPALTDSAYVITNNTATLEAAGTGTYTYTDATHGEIFFTAETPMLVLNVIENNTSISFGSNGNYKTHLANMTMYAENAGGQTIGDNGGNNSQIKPGTVITIKVKAGAKISVSSYSGYTSYTVKINGVDYNGGAAETGISWEYEATEDSTVQFVSGNNNYFYGISVGYGLTTISEDKTFASTNGVDSNSEIEFNGVQDHNSGEYWNLGKTGSIKIKVAAGAKITLTCGYWGVGITINGEVQDTSGSTVEYTSTDGGEIVIGCTENASNVSYLQKIEVTFPAA